MVSMEVVVVESLVMDGGDLRADLVPSGVFWERAGLS